MVSTSRLSNQRSPAFKWTYAGIMAAFLAAAWGLTYLWQGPGFMAGFWPIELAISSVIVLGVVLFWDQYPLSASLDDHGVTVNHLLGRTRVAWKDLGPPSSYDGPYVVFGTSPDAPGYRGSAFRVDKRTAKQILLSPNRPPWPVPPAFQRFLEEP